MKGTTVTQLTLLSLIALVNSQQPLQKNIYEVGNKREFDRDFMHFGKRASSQHAADDAFDRNFMNFGKRVAEGDFSRDFMNFGKRALGPNMRFLSDLYDDYRQKRDFDRDFMHFGKRSAADRWPYQGADKRDEAFSRDFLSFGKRR